VEIVGVEPTAGVLIREPSGKPAIPFSCAPVTLQRNRGGFFFTTNDISINSPRGRKKIMTTKNADQIRIDQLPHSVEIYETTDLSDLLAPSNLLARVKRGDSESRQSATARALIVAGAHLLARENW
jgi:hypothetical protein